MTPTAEQQNPPTETTETLEEKATRVRNARLIRAARRAREALASLEMASGLSSGFFDGAITVLEEEIALLDAQLTAAGEE